MINPFSLECDSKMSKFFESNQVRHDLAFFLYTIWHIFRKTPIPPKKLKVKIKMNKNPLARQNYLLVAEMHGQRTD